MTITPHDVLDALQLPESDYNKEKRQLLVNMNVLLPGEDSEDHCCLDFGPDGMLTLAEVIKQVASEARDYGWSECRRTEDI